MNTMSGRQVYQALRPLIDELFTRVSGVVTFANNSPFVPVQQFGAKADAQIIQDASIGAASSDVHSPSAPFKPSDVGKVMLIPLAGVAGAPLVTTIVAFVSTTDVTVGTPATTPVVAGPAAWGTDNGTAIQNAINATAGPAAYASGTGVTIYFPGPFGSAPDIGSGTGMYLVGPQGGSSLKNGTRLYGPGATIITALDTVASGPVGVLFSYFNVASGPSLTLSANTNPGDHTISVNGGTFQKGNYLTIRDPAINANQGGTYLVLSANVANPQTVTLDRGMGFPYVAATAGVQLLASGPEQHLRIEGFTFTGTCSRTIELSDARFPVLFNLRWDDVVAAPTNLPCAFDNFTFGGLAEKIDVLGGNGPSFEGCDSCTLSGFTYEGRQAANAPGFSISDGYNNVIEKFSISGAGTGTSGISAFVQLPSTSILGNPALTIRDGSITACLGQGVLNGGTAPILLERVSILNCATAGVTGNPGPVWLKGCTIQRNAGGACNLSGAGSSIDDSDLSFNGATNADTCDGAIIAATCALRNVTIQPDPNAVNNHVCLFVTNALGTDFDVQIEGGVIALGGANAGVGLASAGGANAHVHVRGTRFTQAQANSIAIEQASGVTDVSGCDIVGSGGGGDFGFFIAGGTLRYKGTRIRGVAAPYHFVGGFVNQGQTVQANGAAAVAVPWPDLQAGEMPKLNVTTQPTAGGIAAVGALLVALTPGTGFSITSVAGNNAVYQYEV